MSGYWDAPNWGAKDRDRYQRELDTHLTLVREQTAERAEQKRADWFALHAGHRGEIECGAGYGAGWCSGCGETFNG